jgi:hypothetical protein
MKSKRALKDAARDPLVSREAATPGRRKGRRRKIHPAFRIGLAVLLGFCGGWYAGRFLKIL